MMCCGLYYDECFGQGINAKEVRFMVIINNGVLVALSRIHVTKLFVVYLQTFLVTINICCKWGEV